MTDVCPNIKCCCWQPFHRDSDTCKFREKIISFLSESALQSPRVTSDEIKFHEWKSQFLKGGIGSSIKK